MSATVKGKATHIALCHGTTWSVSFDKAIVDLRLAVRACMHVCVWNVEGNESWLPSRTWLGSMSVGECVRGRSRWRIAAWSRSAVSLVDTYGEGVWEGERSRLRGQAWLRSDALLVDVAGVREESGWRS